MHEEIEGMGMDRVEWLVERISLFEERNLRVQI